MTWQGRPCHGATRRRSWRSTAPNVSAPNAPSTSYRGRSMKVDSPLCHLHTRTRSGSSSREGGVRLRHRAAEPLRRGRLAEDSPGGDRGPVALIPELVYDELSGAGRVTSSTRPYSLASVTSSHRPVWKS